MTGRPIRGAISWSVGFALLEVMITLLIMLLGTLLITRAEMQLHQSVQRATQREQARALAQSQLEALHACVMGHNGLSEGEVCSGALAEGEHRLSPSPLTLRWRVTDNNASGSIGSPHKAVQVIASWQVADQSELVVTLQGGVLALPPRGE